MLNPELAQALLRPRSVAIVGASDDPERIGGRSISYMKNSGFKGAIYPINPNRPQVQGLPAFPNVAALPATPDIAIIAVPASQAPRAALELAERGVRAAIVFSAGFAEAGGPGVALQEQLVAAARGQGMRLLGPNSLGLFNLHSGFVGSFCSSMELWFPRPGRLGIASQSGAYGGHLVAAAAAAGIGLSTVVLTGNEADLTLGDAVQLLVDDPDTGVIALYAEGVREADRLIAALQAARARRKPVVMMKVGRSARGGVAAQSHTASIAGDDAVIGAVLAELGVLRAEDTEQLLDIAGLAAHGIFPQGNTLGVLTVSGGGGIIACDAAEALGLPMPEVSAATQAELRALVPFSSPANPVDMTAQFVNDVSLISRFARAAIADCDFKSILYFLTYAGGTPAVARQLMPELAALRRDYPDKLFALVVQAGDALLQAYREAGFCVFNDPTRAVTAIAAMGRLGEIFASPPPPRPAAPAPIALPASTPSEAAAKAILRAAGIDSPPEAVCADAERAVAAAREIGFPVVLKIASPDILHKTEIGGVLLDVASEDAVRAGFARLIERARQAAPGARIEGVLVARQLRGGVECIMGIHRDPVFGPVAMFGLGGIFVELLKDVVFHRCPFDQEVAARLIGSIKGAALLQGARGRPVADIAALAQMLSRLSVFAAAAGPRLRSVDLNPVLALPAGQGAFALDAVIEPGNGS